MSKPVRKGKKVDVLNVMKAKLLGEKPDVPSKELPEEKPDVPSKELPEVEVKDKLVKRKRETFLPALSMPAEKRSRSSSDLLKKEQITKAVAALQKWVQSRKDAGRPKLFEDGELVYLVVSLKKTPERAYTNPDCIPVPHSLHPNNGTQEVCLLVKDTDGEGHRSAKERIRSSPGTTGVTKVIGVSKLRTKYRPHEAKRKLCGSYDLFLADDRILPLLPKLLGKAFFKKKKHPIPVRLSRGEWATEIRRACDSVFFYVGDGTCSTVKVALAEWSLSDIVENVMAAAEGVGKCVPKKWPNIQALYIRTAESASIPIYASLPDVPMKIRV